MINIPHQLHPSADLLLLLNYIIAIMHVLGCYAILPFLHTDSGSKEKTETVSMQKMFPPICMCFFINRFSVSTLAKRITDSVTAYEKGMFIGCKTRS